nr:hypothetical protein [uncultured Flavobacterium sp.]
MAKILKIKEVNSNIEIRMKDFEKLRLKLKTEKAKRVNKPKEGKGLLKSISDFFSDPLSPPKKLVENKQL